MNKVIVVDWYSGRILKEGEITGKGDSDYIEVSGQLYQRGSVLIDTFEARELFESRVREIADLRERANKLTYQTIHDSRKYRP